MSILQTVIGAIASSGGAPTYTLTPAADNVNEGSSLTFTVGGTNIADGTYYWIIADGSWAMGDFATTSGTVVVTSNSGTFSITPTADVTTEGAETFNVTLRSGSITGTILATSTSVTITDTSLTAPTYTLTPAANNVNEGSSLEFTVGGTDITNGNYYWTVTNSGDFGTTEGTFSITSNTGSFSVTPTEDATTEGAETFTVSIRSGSVEGTILQTSSSITINDTSLTPVAPFSLDFPAGDPYVLVSNTQTDWALGTTYTIEYWSKQTNASENPRPILTVMSQGPGEGQIDMGHMYGHLLWNGGEPITPDPAAAVWTHVAFVADGGGNITLYYNGVNQTTFNTGPALTNGSSDLYIGRRAGVNGQGFYGKLAMIRISTTAKYLTNFSPSLSYGVEADTKLMLGSDTPLVDSVGTHPISNVGAVISMDFPHNFIGHLNAYSGGNLGTTYMIFGDPNITAFSQIPVGARITSNLAGFGIRQVTGNGAYYEGLQITYDSTGLPGGTVSTTSDTYNFYW